MRHAAIMLGIVLIGLATFGLTAAEPGAQVRMRRADGAVAVSSGDKEVLRYQIDRPAAGKLPVESACCFHPQRTPGGTVVTEVAPIDHPHHPESVPLSTRSSSNAFTRR